MVFFMSKKAAASQYCFEEVHYAVDSGKCVLPVMIEPCFEQITGGMKLLLGSRHIIEVDQNDESKATLASMKQVSKRISEELDPTSTVQEQEGSVSVGSEGCVQQELEQLLARAQMKLKARAKSTATAGRYKKAAAVEEEAPVKTAMVHEEAAAGVVDDADPIGNQVLQNSAEISGQSSDDGLEKHAGMPSVMCTAPAMLRRAREGCDPVGDVEGG